MRPHVSLRIQSVGHRVTTQPRSDVPDALVVHADHTVRWVLDTVGKRLEGLQQVLLVAISDHMFQIYVCYHRVVRTKLQEGAVALIRFGYQKVAMSEPRIAAELRDHSSDHTGRIEPGINKQH